MPVYNNLIDALTAVLFAIAGRLARLLNNKNRARLKRSAVLAELFLGGFIGIMLLMFVRTVGLSSDWTGLVCGMAGWIGPRMLDALVKPAGKAVGIEIDETKGKQ